MDAPVDLYSASREDLIALLLAQRERLADQEQDLARLRAEVATQQAAMAALQERVGVLLAILDPPDGDDPASRPTTMPGRVEVTEHIYLERRCPRCRGRWLPAPELDGVVIGQRRLGIGLLSLMARVHEELRLPIAGIQWYRPARGVPCPPRFASSLNSYGLPCESTADCPAGRHCLPTGCGPNFTVQDQCYPLCPN